MKTNMTKKEFRQSMMAGLGRTYIALKTGDREEYREVVQEGCLTNFSYDTQANGTAEQYIYRLVNCYDDPLSFLAPLVKMYREMDFTIADDWDVLYYTRLITLFGKDGAADAIKVIHEKYEDALKMLKNPDRKVEGWLEYDKQIYSILGGALLDIDGVKAYVKIACDLNDLNVTMHIRCLDLPWLMGDLKYLPESPDFETYVKENSEADLSTFLNDYAYAKEHDYGYYDDGREDGEESDPLIEEVATDDMEVCEELPDPDLAYPFYDWALSAEHPSVWKKYAGVKDKMTEAREEAAMALKTLERYIPRPNEISLKKLLEYLNHFDSDVRDAAEEIFADRNGEEDIAYAIKFLSANGPTWWALRPLLNNYKPENESFIVYMMSKLRFEIEDKDHWHAIVFGIVDSIYYKNVELPRSVLTICYERSLCMSCREELLSFLYKKKWLTPEMKKECYYDASYAINKFAEKHKFEKEEF